MVETARDPPPRAQIAILGLVLVVASALVVPLGRIGAPQVALFGIGLVLGAALYHAAFGFASAYRNAIVGGDLSAVAAQLVMLAVAILLFAPVLAHGSAFGRPVVGAVAPVGVAMALGAFVFGIGMQLAGGCASGTLYAAGGGSARMAVVLVFFCLGGFWASLHMPWWTALPGIGAVSLGERLGWAPAVALQLALLAGVWSALRLVGGRIRRPLWGAGGFSRRRMLAGPWPLLLAALLLAFGNWLTLLVAGHPWSITWAFTLWPAKVAVALGWDPATSPFWSGEFQRLALSRPVLADTVSVMNVGILLGALTAAALAGRVAPSLRIPAASLAAAVIGGLTMGYGARLAYGCNIGAFFSGVASGSLHGWVWIGCAVFGNLIGIRLRPLFRLPA
ncbi:MAG: YeeE/YedE family protein [Rhodospirillales bacterium]